MQFRGFAGGLQMDQFSLTRPVSNQTVSGSIAVGFTLMQFLGLDGGFRISTIHIAHGREQ